MHTSPLLDAISNIARLFPLILVIFTVTNFSRSLVAYLLGDTTPLEYGYLTLNPLAHVHIINVVVFLLACLPAFYFIPGFAGLYMVLFFVIFSNQMIYRVPVDVGAFRWQKVGAFVYAFGPQAVEILFCIGALLLFKIAIVSQFPAYAIVTLCDFIREFLQIILFWVVMDSIPLPPFHAGRALAHLVPEAYQPWVEYLEEHAFLILLLLFFAPFTSDFFFGVIGKLRIILQQILVALVV